MLTIAIIVVILVTSLLVTATALWLGGRWLKVSKPTFLRALAALALSRLVSLSLLAASVALPRELKIAALLPLIPVELMGTWLFIKYFFQCSPGRAAVAWLISMIAVPVMLGLLFFVIKPFVGEAFIVPANSMAPAVVGWHHTGVCPKCGSAMYSSANTPGDMDWRLEPDEGICTDCLQAGPIRNPLPDVQEPDRIVVNKLLTPTRWDIIAFHYPRDPKDLYVKRLVGLPGETVFIEEDAVFVNGERQTPPGPLSALKYSANPNPYNQPAGTRLEPYQLKADEFFVLGDFANHSSDSRYWGPVPRGNIEGVVTLCYWPPSRWHIFR